MNELKVFITETAQKEIKQLDLPTKKKVDKAILKFQTNPFDNNTVRLVGHPEAQFRHRIGNYRILFDLVEEDQIYIIRIWPRGKDYKK